METVSDIIRILKKKIKCYIHRTYSQGNPTLKSALGSKTKIFYVIRSKKKFSFVNCGNKT